MWVQGEKTGTTSAFDVAKWFIKNQLDSPRNTYDGNMKLQKLLFFAQLIHVARYGEKLFEEPIYAFKNGSVVEDVRKAYHNRHYQLVADAYDFEDDFNQEQLSTLQLTVEIFGSVDARELSELNHEFESWKIAYHRSRKRDFHLKEESEITIESIMKNDLGKINDILAAYELGNEECYEVVNGKYFYYNPSEITITEDVRRQLQSFQGKESAYSIYYDKNVGLVIY
jgi:uncharacterized phage-associated protein